MTHKAIVTRVRVVEVEGAKTLSQGYCLGFPVAVDRNTRDGDLVLFFNAGLQLSPEFAEANDLVFRGLDDKGNRLGGYFSENRKVSAQKFMKGKIVSEGFACPLSFLDFVGVPYIGKEGEELDSLNGIPICRKFLSKATRNAIKAGKQMENNTVSIITTCAPSVVNTGGVEI